MNLEWCSWLNIDGLIGISVKRQRVNFAEFQGTIAIYIYTLVSFEAFILTAEINLSNIIDIHFARACQLNPGIVSNWITRKNFVS